MWTKAYSSNTESDIISHIFPSVLVRLQNRQKLPRNFLPCFIINHVQYICIAVIQQHHFADLNFFQTICVDFQQMNKVFLFLFGKLLNYKTSVVATYFAWLHCLGLLGTISNENSELKTISACMYAIGSHLSHSSSINKSFCKTIYKRWDFF